MNGFASWVRQPTTLTMLAVAVAGGVYWITGSEAAAGAAAALILGGIDDNTARLISAIERAEGAARSIVKPGATLPFLALGALVGMSGCSADGAARAARAGQLFCAVATSSGPVVVALADATAPMAGASSGAVVMAAGATKAFVDAACAVAGGFAVAPPPNPIAAPVVAIVPPT